MTHYEERLENDLARIQNQVQLLSSQVELALKNAVHALLTGNDKLAHATALGDAPINRLVRHVDTLCHSFIALHLPSAGHLRRISSVIRTNIELERIGDYAVTICRESVQLSKRPEGTVAREVELMAEESRRMLHQSIAAMNEHNAEMAKATMGMADQVERTFDTVFADLTAAGDQWPLQDLFRLFVVFNMLERVSDQAKNICEETVFAVEGTLKADKVYQVLFLDEDNSCQSQMAQAVARKAFPNSGRYSSAGRAAAATVDPTMRRFLEERGVQLSGEQPQTLDLSPQELADYHIIVSLQGPVKSYVAEIPFHTAALEWDVGPAPTGLDQAETTQRLEAMYREIAFQVRELMETLRGPEAA